MGLRLIPALAVICCTITLLLIIQACRKTDWKNDKQNNTFDVKAAKEWWYGDFRKSNEYSLVDYNSPFAPLPNSGAAAAKKYPSWKRGISYKVGNTQIAELPLYYNSPVSIFPGSHKLGKEEKIRIAQATINKVLLFKQSNKSVNVKIASLVPSPEYARQKNYDISSNTLQRPDPNFSGWLIVRNWDESLVRFWQIENGRRVRRWEIVKKQDQQDIHTESGIVVDDFCTPELVEKTGRLCVGNIIIGDEPDEPEDCTDWYEYTYYDVEVRCYPEEQPDPTLEEQCMQMGLTNEECLCLWFGQGCGGEGGGDNGQYQDAIDKKWHDEKVKDSTNNPCITDVVNKLELINTKLPALMRNFLGTNPTFDMVLKTMSNSTWTVDNMGNPVPPAGGRSLLVRGVSSFDVKINDYYANATDLSIAATIMHEALHCQIYVWFNNARNNTALQEELTKKYGFIFPDIFDQGTLGTLLGSADPIVHQTFANKFRDDMGAALYEFAQANGISADSNYCKDIAWQGATDSKAFDNLQAVDQQRIMDRINAEKDPNKNLTDPVSGSTVNGNNTAAKGHPCN